MLENYFSMFAEGPNTQIKVETIQDGHLQIYMVPRGQSISAALCVALATCRNTGEIQLRVVDDKNKELLNVKASKDHLLVLLGCAED